MCENMSVAQVQVTGRGYFTSVLEMQVHLDTLFFFIWPRKMCGRSRRTWVIRAVRPEVRMIFSKDCTLSTKRRPVNSVCEMQKRNVVGARREWPVTELQRLID